MNERFVIIDGKEIKLCASALTLMWYKRLTGNDYYSDRNKIFGEVAKAFEFQRKYESMTDSDFDRLSKEQQAEYFAELTAATIDTTFTLNVICAMAFAGGYKRSADSLFASLPLDMLQSDSELMTAVGELSEMLLPNVKKKQ